MFADLPIPQFGLLTVTPAEAKLSPTKMLASL